MSESDNDSSNAGNEDEVLLNGKLLDVYDELIIGIIGNSITEGETKSSLELGVDMFSKIRKYIIHGRINIDLRDEFKKRETLFSPHFDLKEMTAEYRNALLERYPMNGEIIKKSESELQALWNQYKLIQSLCRNQALPKFSKEAGGKPKSGTYSDEDAVLKVWEFCRKNKILENAKKAKLKYLKAQKELLKGRFNQEEIEDAWEKKTRVSYNTKLLKWKSDDIPTGVACFVLLGKPGKDFSSFQVGGDAGKTTTGEVGKQSRREVRRAALSSKEETKVDQPKPSQNSSTVSFNLLSIKEEELKFAQSEALRAKKREAIAILKERGGDDAKRTRNLLEDSLIEEALALIATPNLNITTPNPQVINISDATSNRSSKQSRTSTGTTSGSVTSSLTNRNVTSDDLIYDTPFVYDGERCQFSGTVEDDILLTNDHDDDYHLNNDNDDDYGLNNEDANLGVDLFNI